MQKRFIRFVSTVLSLLLLAGATLLGGSLPTVAADGASNEPSVWGPLTDVKSSADSHIVSPLTNLYTADGLADGPITAHGGGQTRMVSVSHGAYYALNAYNHEFTEGDRLQVSLIRMTQDGKASVVYQDYIRYYASGPTVLVMADKDENIWMYAGWENEYNAYFTYNLWFYNAADGNVTHYSSAQNELYIEGGYGYSTAFIDPEREIIMATVPGADAPGYLMWSVFDMKTRTWGQAVAAELPYRNAYTFGYADGQGGFYIINQRDVKNETIMSDQGMNVAKAMSAYHSRNTDNNMLFDQWMLGHIKDPAVPEIDYVSVEDPQYQVLLGLYPEFATVCADPLLDSRGYLHFVYGAVDQGEAGCRFTHVVYDTNDNLREVSRKPVRMMRGEVTGTIARLFEDTAGNVYLLGIPGDANALTLEIWRLTEPLGDFRLVWWNDFGVYDFNNSGTMIIANSRGNSTPSDIAFCGVNPDDGWKGFTVDFAALRAIIG